MDIMTICFVSWETLMNEEERSSLRDLWAHKYFSLSLSDSSMPLSLQNILSLYPLIYFSMRMKVCSEYIYFLSKACFEFTTQKPNGPQNHTQNFFWPTFKSHTSTWKNCLAISAGSPVFLSSLVEKNQCQS